MFFDFFFITTITTRFLFSWFSVVLIFISYDDYLNMTTWTFFMFVIIFYVRYHFFAFSFIFFIILLLLNFFLCNCRRRHFNLYFFYFVFIYFFLFIINSRFIMIVQEIILLDTIMTIHVSMKKKFSMILNKSVELN